MPEWLQSILLGAGGAVPLVALAVWKIPAWYGDKWLSNKFATELREFDHKKNTEIEALRLKLNTMFDRRLRLNQAEFDAIPKVWNQIVTTNHKVRILCSGIKRVADLDNMKKEDRDRFYKDRNFPQWKINEIESAQDKNFGLKKAMDIIEFTNAQDEYAKLNTIYIKSTIYLEKELDSRFDELIECYGEILMSRRVLLERDRLDPITEVSHNDIFDTTIDKMMRELENVVRNRLWDIADG